MRCPSFAEFFTLSINRGVQGRPGARCTRVLVRNVHRKSAHTSIQVQRRHSGLPCAMVLRLITCSPRRRIRLVTVASGFKVDRTRLGRLHLRWLDISNGCQNHTPSPYAARPRKTPRRMMHHQRSFPEAGFSAVRLRADRSLTGDLPCDCQSRRRCRVHRISTRVRDDRDPPMGETCGVMPLICPTG